MITAYAGVPSGDDSFRFIIYYNMVQDSSTDEQMSEFSFSQYVDSSIVNVTIQDLSAGMYTFSVVASNLYGDSDRSDPKELTIGWYPLLLYLL